MVILTGKREAGTSSPSLYRFSVIKIFCLTFLFILLQSKWSFCFQMGTPFYSYQKEVFKANQGWFTSKVL